MSMSPTITHIILTHTTPADTALALPGMPSPYHRVETWAFQLVYPWGALWETTEEPEFIHHSVIRIPPEDGVEPHEQVIKTLSKAWANVHGRGPLPKWFYRSTLQASSPVGELKVVQDLEALAGGSRVLLEALRKATDDHDSIGVWVSDSVEPVVPVDGSRLILPDGSDIMRSTTNKDEVPE